jgi:outer membrane protein assembly factor BamB
MKPRDSLFLGLKRRVSALSRRDGTILWSTKLPGMGDFVTLTSDEERLYAYCGGQIHALDFASGDILWSNGLPGYGYGLGSLLVDGQSAPPAAIAAAIAAQAAAAASSGSTTTVAT